MASTKLRQELERLKRKYGVNGHNRNGKPQKRKRKSKGVRLQTLEKKLKDVSDVLDKEGGLNLQTIDANSLENSIKYAKNIIDRLSWRL